MGRLDGRIALVTGAARGIGYAVAACFHAEGAHVVLTDIGDDEGRAATAGTELHVDGGILAGAAAAPPLPSTPEGD